jgi:DNA-binding response OmpR family regulator
MMRVTDVETTITHVLMVDDDAEVCGVVREYLAQNDFRVTAVATGKQMLEVLGSEAIDLLLLDLRLKGEDGMQLAQSVRQSSKVPIVMLTGRIEEADRIMGLELCADDYVTQHRGLRPLHRRADPAPAAQDRARSGASGVHPHRTGRRILLRHPSEGRSLMAPSGFPVEAHAGAAAERDRT